MGDFAIDPIPNSNESSVHDGGQQDRQEWVRANFTEIFGTSAADLQAQGINPRQYAAEHRDQIRQFAQMQRRMGMTVPGGHGAGDHGPGDNGPGNNGPGDNGTSLGRGGYRGYGYGGGRFGMGMRGGSAWIGILIALFALRFLLVDSFAGGHAAIFWVLGIGGVMLVARVLLFSWLRNRRRNPRKSQ